MPAKTRSTPELEFHPATPARWADLERLFGPRGACGGCWCMYWRRARADYERGKGAENKRVLKRQVFSGDEPGILAYVRGEPVGWCSVAPRDRFPVLERSRVLKRVDEEPVWSVVCLFVTREVRGQGVSVALLRAAAEYAASQGARVVEGYPVEAKKTPMPAAFAWTGIASAYRKAGFTEVARRSETRAASSSRLPPPDGEGDLLLDPNADGGVSIAGRVIPHLGSDLEKRLSSGSIDLRMAGASV